MDGEELVDGADEAADDQAAEDESGAPPEDDPDAGDEPAEGDEPPEDEPPSAEGDEDPESWKNLAKKYGTEDPKILKRIVGDKVWEQTRELSRLSRENKELRARLSSAPDEKAGAKPKETAAPPVVPEEIQELDRELQSLDETEKNDRESYARLFNELTETNAEKLKLQGKLEEVPAGEEGQERRDRYEAKLAALEAKSKATLSELNSTRRAILQTGRDKVRLKKERDWYAKVSVEAEARQKQEREEQVAAAKEIPAAVDRLILDTMDLPDVRFPADPMLREDLQDVANSKVTNFIGQQADRGEPWPKVQAAIPKLVKETVQRYMKSHKIAARTSFQDASRRRAAAAPPAREKVASGSAPAKVGLSRYEIAGRNLVRRFERKA